MNHSKARRKAERAEKFTGLVKNEETPTTAAPPRGSAGTSGREWDSEKKEPHRGEATNDTGTPPKRGESTDRP